MENLEHFSGIIVHNGNHGVLGIQVTDYLSFSGVLICGQVILPVLNQLPRHPLLQSLPLTDICELKINTCGLGVWLGGCALLSFLPVGDV